MLQRQLTDPDDVVTGCHLCQDGQVLDSLREQLTEAEGIIASLRAQLIASQVCLVVID